MDWASFIKHHNLVHSMSRRGNCHDNAVAESFYNILKRERIRRRVYRSRDQARQDVFDYIEMFYNPKRKHVRTECCRRSSSSACRKRNPRGSMELGASIQTYVAPALGLAACQKGFSVMFTTAAAPVSQLLEARNERRLLKLQRGPASAKLLIIDELGCVSLSSTGAELLFETFSQHYERGSTIVASNLPFEDRTSVLGSERLTGELFDRLSHHVSLLTMNGDSYRLKLSAARRRVTQGAEQNQGTQASIPKSTKSSNPNRDYRRRHGNGPDRGHFHVGTTALQLVCFYSAVDIWPRLQFKSRLRLAGFSVSKPQPLAGWNGLRRAL